MCACCTLPSHSIPPQSWGPAQRMLWPRFPLCHPSLLCPSHSPWHRAAPRDSVHWAGPGQGAPTPERCWNGTEGLQPKAVPESGEQDVEGLEQCITKHFGDRAGSPSLQLMVGNPCHWALVLAETNAQFQPHLCELPQSWMKLAELRLLQAFQGCGAPGQAELSNSTAAK